MNKTQTRRTFIVLVGPSHAGKFLMLYPFQEEPRFGITDQYLWPNSVTQKFFKDALNVELKNPNEVQHVSELDNNVLMNFNIDPFMTEYFKDPNPNMNFYYVLVNSDFKNAISKRLNNPLHIFIPMVRDPRVLWIVDRSTDDKNSPRFKDLFFRSMLEFTESYKKYIVNKERVSIVFFERLIDDFSKTIRNTVLKQTRYMDRGTPLELKRPSQKVNHFFTTDDRDNNKWFGYKDQKQLDEVSRVCREYIDIFNYRQRLTVEEIYEGV